MGFFNKKELARIEELEATVSKMAGIIDIKNRQLGKIDDLSEELVDAQNKNLLLASRIDKKESEIEGYEDDVVKFLTIIASLEEQVENNKDALGEYIFKAAKFKEALIEIAEYDFDRHKKAYLLNDFFQERAKKALSEE